MEELQVKQKMQGVFEHALSDTATIRSGRATPALVENIIVNAYGGAQKLRILELASITSPDPTTLVISPWDKSIIGEIKQAILMANVGMNPNIDGEIIRITIPPMTSEDRERFVKLLSSKLETARVEIRQVRAEAMHDIKKAFEAKEISEDERFAKEKTLQSQTDEFIKKIDDAGETKKKELLTV